MPKEVRGLLLSMDLEWFSDEMRETARKEKEYQRDLEAWHSYQNWRKNRNPKRQVSEDAFGYDLKHAMHLVRLINMCKEILVDKTLTVYRPDREMLLDIRNGSWTYDHLEKYADDSQKELEKLYNESTLRHKPNRDGIQNLYHEICEEFYRIKI
jgi:hypothetical protein